MISSSLKALMSGCSAAGRRCCRFLIAARSWLMVLLLLILVGPGRALRSGADRLADSNGVWNTDLPQLDSFSEPAVAAAILQQQVQSLFQNYLLTNKSGAMTPGVSADGQSNGARPSDQESVWALDRRIRALRIESLQNLLVIHSRNGSANDFLDAYLELLAVAPERAAMRCWTREALDCSRTCGRTDEVLDALQHVTRFSRNTRIIAWIQVSLENWNREVNQGVAAEDGLAPECSPSNSTARLLRPQPSKKVDVVATRNQAPTKLDLDL